LGVEKFIVPRLNVTIQQNAQIKSTANHLRSAGAYPSETLMVLAATLHDMTSQKEEVFIYNFMPSVYAPTQEVNRPVLLQ
jgi:hypothetical protein